eukprot:m51a1_g4659 putative nicotinate-nucleotide pyrophosphorylase (347) ;mRNA; r:77389-79299
MATAPAAAAPMSACRTAADVLGRSRACGADLAALEPRASELVALALSEDLPDVTCAAILGPQGGAWVHGRVAAKEDGVLCGVCLVPLVFARVDQRCHVVLRERDGTRVTRGQVVADVYGPAASVLSGERTALNFLQRLSGVATRSAWFAEAAAKATEGRERVCRVLDTRKTTPGWRGLEKYATRCGGVVNHRFSLADMALIKDNHITVAGSVSKAVELVRQHADASLPIEVEVRNDAELREALAVEPPLTRIMLDNMDAPTMVAACATADAAGTAGRRRVPLEASGGVSLETIARVAATGVDYVSVGSVTHSAQALDLHMKVTNMAAPLRSLEEAAQITLAEATRV